MYGLKKALFALLNILIFSSVCYGAFETEALYVTGLTNNRLVATGSDSDKDIVSVANLCDWIAGTANQIVCTDDGDGTLTLDFPDAVSITTSLTVPLIIGSGGTGNNLTINSNSANDGLIVLGNSTTGLVFDEDDEAATIGGGEIVHTINGSNEKSLFEFHKDGNTAPGGISFHRHSNTDALSSNIVFLRSKGDHATPLIVADGSSLGKIRATGYDGTDEAEAAEIDFQVDGTPGNDDMPGRIIFKASADGTQAPIEKVKINFGSTYVNSLSADHDFIAAGDTEANLFRVDAGADEVRQGDWDTNYAAVDKLGDVHYVAGGGLQFGEIYYHGAGADTVLAAQDTWYQILSFGTDGESNADVTPSNAQDHITVGKAGRYLISFSASARSAAANTYEFMVKYNNGGSDCMNIMTHRTTSTANRLGVMAVTGICDIPASGTVELWIERIDGGAVAKTITLEHVNLVITQLGGTT